MRNLLPNERDTQTSLIVLLRFSFPPFIPRFLFCFPQLSIHSYSSNSITIRPMSNMDEKSAYPMEDTFKGQSAHFEHAGERTPSSTEGGVPDGMVRRPARMYTPEEEKKLYRKVRLTFFPTFVSQVADPLCHLSSPLHIII